MCLPKKVREFTRESGNEMCLERLGHVGHGRTFVFILKATESNLFHVFCHFFQFKKQKLLLELDQYAPDVAELIRTPMEMRYIPLKVALL